MENNKKGTDVRPSVPTMKNHSNITTIHYNKLRNLCLTISFVAIAIIVIAYFKHSSNAGMFGTGMLFASMLVECVLNPIEEDE